MHTNELAPFLKAPSVYYTGTIQIVVSTPQFKNKEALELFLKGVLEDYNGTEFKRHAIPVIKTEEPYS